MLAQTERHSLHAETRLHVSLIKDNMVLPIHLSLVASKSHLKKNNLSRIHYTSPANVQVS